MCCLELIFISNFGSVLSVLVFVSNRPTSAPAPAAAASAGRATRGRRTPLRGSAATAVSTSAAARAERQRAAPKPEAKPTRTAAKAKKPSEAAAKGGAAPKAEAAPKRGKAFAVFNRIGRTCSTRVTRTAGKKRKAAEAEISDDESKRSDMLADCVICLSKFEYPVSLQCGHTFCKCCLLDWEEMKKTNCPVCRTPSTSMLLCCVHSCSSNAHVCAVPGVVQDLVCSPDAISFDKKVVL